MKILFITSRFPWPLTKGDKLRAWNQIKYLSEDNEIILFAITEEKMQDDWIGELKPYCSKISVSHLPKWKIILNLLRNLFSRLPFQSMYYYSPQVLKKIIELNDKEKPDKLMFQLIRTATYAKHFTTERCVIDLMDCLSYHYLLRSKNASLIKKLFYKWEYRKIKKYEQSLLKKYNNVVIISEKDKELLSGNKTAVKVISNGVNKNSSSPETPVTDLLFIGNMAYEPNLVAARFLINEVLPRLQTKKPGIKLTIAGIDAIKKIGATNNRNITIMENVADIRPLLAGSKIFAAPMYLSTGVQNKVLEAMASGLPVITTPNAAGAIGAINGTHLLTAVSASEFTSQVVRLLDLPQLTKHLTGNARVLVDEHFDWQRNTEKLHLIFSDRKTAQKAAILH